MKSLYISTIFLIFAASFVLGQVPPVFNETCESGKYPPDQATIAPTYVINLDLPPSERWKPLAKQYIKPIQDLVTYIKAFVVEFSPKLQKIINLVDNDLGSLAYTLPSPYKEEIISIANATNINLGEIVLYNVFYEIFTLCTSIVGSDANGNMYHARNLDFGLFLGWDLPNDTWKLSELLRPLIMNVNYTRGGVLQYRTVTFVGFVGLITGIRPNVMSISINERFGLDGGYIGLVEWILNTDRNQSWTTFAARDALENGLSFTETVQMLSTVPVMAPCYYIIGGPEPYQGSVVTRNRENSADVWNLDASKPETWYLAETNYDHWKPPLFIDDRITPANNCMKKLGQKSLSFDGLFNVLSSKPVLNKLTVYTALMELKTGRVETYIQYCKTPCWPF
jgi:acid ceramidase